MKMFAKGFITLHYVPLLFLKVNIVLLQCLNEPLFRFLIYLCDGLNENISTILKVSLYLCLLYFFDLLQICMKSQCLTYLVKTCSSHLQ